MLSYFLFWSNVVALVSTQRTWYVFVWRPETRPIPTFFFINDLQLLHNEKNQQQCGRSQNSWVTWFPSFTEEDYTDEEDRDEGNGYGDDPSLEPILLSISTGEDDSFASFLVTACEWYIMNNIVDNPWTTGDINELSYNSCTREPVSQKAQWFHMNFIRV